jgi:acyl carrier protein
LGRGKNERGNFGNRPWNYCRNRPDEDISALKVAVPLWEQLDLDFMDFLGIVMELRKRYSMDVPEADYPHLESLDSCAAYLANRFQ